MFTFYETVRVEAIKMIRVLGIYLVKYFGSKGIVPYLDRQYWKATYKWNYSSKRQCFITPEDNHVRDNLINDRNRTALDKIMDKELRDRD